MFHLWFVGSGRRLDVSQGTRDGARPGDTRFSRRPAARISGARRGSPWQPFGGEEQKSRREKEQTVIWNREPALVLAVVQALFAVAVGFGVDLSSEQLTTLVALSSALLGFAVRRQVSPLSSTPAAAPAPPAFSPERAVSR
jgi:hypothetical protein